MKFLEVKVQAYSGYRGAERPLEFVQAGRRYEVARVVDRWYEGGLDEKDQKLDYFKVITVSGEEFLLRYNALFDAWSLLAD